MEVCDVVSAKEKAEFVAFAYQVYRDTPAYRDNLGFACKSFLYQTDSFARECRMRPVVVREDGAVVARCVLLAHPGLDAAQVSFFEPLPERRTAVDPLLDAADAFTAEHGQDTILIGMNGHTSNGVGFLCDRFEEPNPFDGVYTRDYYPAYFRGRGFAEHGLVTYLAREDRFRLGPKLLGKVQGRFTVRAANLRRLRAEMEILGTLFNETLRGTPFFFPRPIEEWYEVFHDLAPLLTDENILYVMEDGREVGFLFWHPNYNMIKRVGGKNSVLGFYFKYLLGKRSMTEFKINAIGVLPEYRGSGAILALFHALGDRVRGRFPAGETGFVCASNLSSARVCRRFCGPPHRHYVVFEAARGAR